MPVPCRNISYTGWYVLWYQKIAFNIFVYCIPAAGILVLNALTGWRLWTMPREGSGKKVGESFVGVPLKYYKCSRQCRVLCIWFM